MTAIISTDPSIDIEDVKRVSAALVERHRARLMAPSASTALSNEQRAANALLAAWAEQADLPTARLGELAERRLAERRRLSAERRAGRAQDVDLDRAAFDQAVANQREALDEPGLLSTFEVLDRPFLIMETPRTELDIFIDAHFETLNSSVKILAEKHSGADSTQFTFHFLWTNTAATAAVFNVSTSLTLNGFCEAIADTGIFSGHESWVSIGAFLSLIRWSGWGVDPATGQSRDQTPFPVSQSTQFKQVAFLDVHGGGLFGDVGIEERDFHFEPFPLSCDLIAVPAGASMVFEVSLLVQYGFSDGGEADLVKLDFATTDRDRRVICPLVALELLTANAQL